MKNSSKDAIELSRYISEYLSDYVPTHLTNSNNTWKSYETALTLYVGYLEDECGVTPDKFSQKCFDQEHIEGWLKWLSESRRCSAVTCNNRLSAIRAFTKYLSSRSIKYVTVNTSAVNVPYRKTAKKKVTGLSREAVKALLAEPDTHKKAGIRDLTLMVLLYATAARIDELLSIKIKDLYLTAGKPYVIITGKGGKIRTLYLLPKAVGFLQLYSCAYRV